MTASPRTGIARRLRRYRRMARSERWAPWANDIGCAIEQYRGIAAEMGIVGVVYNDGARGEARCAAHGIAGRDPSIIIGGSQGVTPEDYSGDLRCGACGVIVLCGCA